ncbi:unnamed protein product, partial [Aureobasidium mustum]
MFFPTLLRRAAALPKFDFARNPYKAKRTWPPDFAKLSQKHQFRLERRYRRRAKLKWARPTWTKFVKLSTWATISYYYARATNDMFGTARRTPPIKPRATSEQDQSAS